MIIHEWINAYNSNSMILDDVLSKIADLANKSYCWWDEDEDRADPDGAWHIWNEEPYDFEMIDTLMEAYRKGSISSQRLLEIFEEWLLEGWPSDAWDLWFD